MSKDLIMYTRTAGCPFVSTAKQVFTSYGVAYRELYIDKDDDARQRVLDWTGFLAVPTLVVANPGEVLPYEAPSYLERGRSPRGINRGAMITEPTAAELTAWLRQHGFIEAAAVEGAVS